MERDKSDTFSLSEFNIENRPYCHATGWGSFIDKNMDGYAQTMHAPGKICLRV